MMKKISCLIFLYSSTYADLSPIKSQILLGLTTQFVQSLYNKQHYTLENLIKTVSAAQYPQDDSLSKTVKEFIDAGVRPDQLYPTGSKHSVSKKDAKGNIVQETVDGAESALHWISLGSRGVTQVINVALKAPQVNVNVQNSYGQTPLYLAAAHLDNQALEALLDAGADPNIASISGTTPLHVAAEKGNTHAVVALLNRGAKTNIVNIYGNNALGSASRYIPASGDTFMESQKQKIINKIQQASGTLSETSQQQVTQQLIDWVRNDATYKTKGDWMTKILELIQAGARPDQTDASGETALHYLALKKPKTNTEEYSRQLKIAEVLLKYTSNVDVKNKLGQTPLYLAAENTESTAMLEALLAAGANPNMQNDAQATPLHVAAFYANIPAAEALLKAGAKKNVQNKFHNIPTQNADYALKQGNITQAQRDKIVIYIENWKQPSTPSTSNQSLNQQLGKTPLYPWEHPGDEDAMHTYFNYSGIAWQLIEKSEKFGEKNIFPTTNNLIKNIIARMNEKNTLVAGIIGFHATNTYPIIHKKSLELMDKFLAYKRAHGSAIEKALYATMSRSAFIDRLLTKRPLTFYMPWDEYLLRDTGIHRSGGFEAIGSQDQQAPLILNEYLSYDEMAVSALLGISAPTYFINDGNRDNAAAIGTPGTYEEQGVYVALVGARLERENAVEYKHMVITQAQNTQANGYGLTNNASSLLGMWEAFYDLKFPTYEEAAQEYSKNPNGRYRKIGAGYLDTYVHKKRARLYIDPFLLDAQARGKAANKKVYLRVTGIGLGNWAIDKTIQNQLIIDTYKEVLQELSSKEKKLPNISDIEFQWFDYVSDYSIEKSIPGITINFTKNSPAAKLPVEHANQLLIACFAWDGNSFVGNEYWANGLSASGDPAAACSALLPELMNPFINEHVAAQFMKAY